MAKPGDIVRSKFGVVYEVMEYSHATNCYRIHLIGENNNSGIWIEASGIDGWDLFRKVNK